MGNEELLKHINDIDWKDEKLRSKQKRKHSSDDR